MKKKLTLVVALGLVLATLLSACGAAETLTIGDVLNESAVYDEAPLVLSSGSEVSALAKTTVVEQKGNLVYLTQAPEITEDDIVYERHVVYNVDTGNVLYNVSESKKTEISVSLQDIENMNIITYDSFFVVQTTVYNLDEDSLRTNITKQETALYDCAGTTLDTVSGSASAIAAIDVVYFNGKCYRTNDDGSLFYAFDYSVLSAFPEELDAKVNDQYYDFVYEGDKGVKIYDKEFKYLGEFEIPSYAQLGSVNFLDEEKLLIQYFYELDEDDKNFSFIYGDSTDDGDSALKAMGKYNLVTVIHDPIEIKTKEIDCPYLLGRTVLGREYEDDIEQLNLESAQTVLYAYEIVDERLSKDVLSLHTVGVNTKGEFFELEGINGETLTSVYMVGENKWIASTINFTYLVDGEGTVIGEISNATQNDKFFYNEGMIFNSDLTLAYNAPSNKMTVESVLEGTFLFKNYDGELFCYDGSDSNKIISKKAVKTSTHVVLDPALVLIIDASDITDINCEFYNAKGTKVFTTDFVSFDTMNEESVIRTENAVLLPSVDTDGNVVYYRFH